MAFALVSHVQIPGTANGPSTSAAIVTTGADLILQAAHFYSPSAPGAWTDNKGNTYTLVATASGSIVASRIYYCSSPTVGTGHTFSTPSASTIFAQGQAQAWSGSSLSSVLDTSSTAFVNGVQSTLQPGSVTPAAANSLIVTGVAFNFSNSVEAIGSGFTISDQDTDTLATDVGGAFAYLVQGAASAVNPTWTATPASTDGLAAVIAVFKPVVASSGVGPIMGGSIMRGAIMGGRIMG